MASDVDRALLREAYPWVGPLGLVLLVVLLAVAVRLARRLMSYFE